MNVTFEPMTAEHVTGATELSRRADWPHRPEDWELSRSISSAVVGVEEGRVVASIMMTPYGESAATINMVIVDESMRGRGLGRQLMEQVLDLAEGRTCSLVATTVGLPLYEKLGFVAVGEVVQHQGTPSSVAQPAGVEWAMPDDLSRITELDRLAYGHDRSQLLRALADAAKFIVIRKGGEIEAFAAIREFGRGKVIGPVVAGTRDEALKLIDFLLAQNQGQFVRIDTRIEIGISPDLSARGLSRVGDGVAMVRAGPPIPKGQPQSHRSFALASQALG